MVGSKKHDGVFYEAFEQHAFGVKELYIHYVGPRIEYVLRRVGEALARGIEKLGQLLAPFFRNCRGEIVGVKERDQYGYQNENKSEDNRVSRIYIP